jgi:hypothetical protein
MKISAGTWPEGGIGADGVNRLRRSWQKLMFSRLDFDFFPAEPPTPLPPRKGEGEEGAAPYLAGQEPFWMPDVAFSGPPVPVSSE